MEHYYVHRRPNRRDPADAGIAAGLNPPDHQRLMRPIPPPGRPFLLDLPNFRFVFLAGVLLSLWGLLS